METASEKEKDLVENIQYYHDCWDIAQKRRDALQQGNTFRIFNYEQETDEHAVTEEDESGTYDQVMQEQINQHFDEQAINRARLR